MADTFLTDQITEIETIIANINAAINALLTGTHQSYLLDTGQTQQRVTRLDLDALRKMRSDYISERDELRASCGLGRSVVTVGPCF